MDPTDTVRITIPDHVLSQPVADAVVLLDMRSEQYYSLDDVGADMWQALRETGDMRAAVDALLEQYDVERERLTADLREFTAQLEAAGLLAYADG
jgi:hypothetical protein